MPRASRCSTSVWICPVLFSAELRVTPGTTQPTFGTSLTIDW
jgi:hypothetical protein